MSKSSLFAIVVFCLMIQDVVCQGDRLKMFRFCLDNCLETGCVKLLRFRSQKLTAYLNCSIIDACNNQTRFWTWDCKSSCQYGCMIKQEDYRELHGRRIVKYYGKWPFRRVLGCQEFLSVLFSLGNLIINLLSLFRLQKAFKKTKYEYGYLWTVQSYLCVNSWIWSAIFHMRDLPWTQSLDYVSANLSIFFGLFASVLRVFEIKDRMKLALTTVVISSGFLHHVSYLCFISFDFKLNMRICLLLFSLQGLLWISWVHNIHHPGRFSVYCFFGSLMLAMLFEVFDFSPIWNLLDAHAVWHACTIPITPLWYHFLQSDVYYLTNQSAIRKS